MDPQLRRNLVWNDLEECCRILVALYAVVCVGLALVGGLVFCR